MLERLRATIRVLETLHNTTDLAPHLRGTTFTPRERTILDSVISQQTLSDTALSRRLFGEAARVDARYRMTIQRILDKLEEQIAPTLRHEPVASGRRRTIEASRTYYMAALYSRIAPAAARVLWHKVLHDCPSPETAWNVPLAFLTLARAEANRLNARTTRQYLQAHRKSLQDLHIISQCESSYLEILAQGMSSPSRDQRRISLARMAREWLAHQSPAAMSAVVCLSASRLAITVSQTLHDQALGLTWCEVQRTANTALGIDPGAVAREYHANRLFTFTACHNFDAAIAEARVARSVTPHGSSTWFLSTEALAEVLLQQGHFEEAYHTMLELHSHPRIRQQPEQVKERIDDQITYCCLFMNRARPKRLRFLASQEQDMSEHSPARRVHVAMFTIVRSIGQGNHTSIIDNAQRFRRYTLTSNRVRQDRALCILAKLLLRYAKAECDIARCRESTVTRRLEKELAQQKVSGESMAIVPWQLVWGYVSDATSRVPS